MALAIAYIYTMKKWFFFFLIVLPVLGYCQKDSSAGAILRKAGGLLSKVKNTSSGLSNEDIIAGLKEALSVGASNSATQLSAMDGYFANAAIRIMMPPEARKVETALRSAGLGAYVDKAIVSMNRAAEDAAVKSTAIFKEAIRGMTVQDALGILRGADTAATGYLRNKTYATLTSAFRPVIDASLQKTDATRYWKDVFDTYNKLPTTFNKVNPDLSAYVTERALSGLFIQIAQEEQKIRKDPAARVTDLLRKVFAQ